MSSSMEKDRVSIIIPTHNRAEYLKKAIASALNQTYKHIEIIVIANGCQDNTTDIVTQLKTAERQSERDTPIVYLEFPHTLGGAKARNLGIDKARGEYIAFLDDDDIWHRDKLYCQIQLLKDNRYSIISGHFIYYYGKEGTGKQINPANKARITLSDLDYDNALGGFSLCITKKIYIGDSRIDESLDALQDWDLWLKILINIDLPAYINPQCLVYCHLGEHRISTNFYNIIRAQRHFLTKWQYRLDKSSIDFHKMRTVCLSIKTQTQGKYRHYFLTVPRIIWIVFNSPYRYKIKKYIHYLLLPIANIDKVRIWLWSKRK